MKRTMRGVFMMVMVLAFLPTGALAEHLSGQRAWRVTYSANGRMNDNYSTREFVESMRGLQPGDDITFNVALGHENEVPADWYLANEVIKTLEEQDADASGSAYGYLLTYEGPAGTRTLYDSVTVGGDAAESQGLHDATDALEEYLFLDRLEKGQAASVTLRVTLDGETEGNAYFNTLARLKMSFTVQPEDAQPSSRTVVRTGDWHDEVLIPFYAAMLVSGTGLAVLARQSVVSRRGDGEGAAR